MMLLTLPTLLIGLILHRTDAGTFASKLGLTSSQSECPLVTSIDGIEESSMCIFTVLSLTSYIYRPGQEMNFMLLSTSSKQQATFYNVEVIDLNGRPVGQFLEGDNICSDGTMLTNEPKLDDLFPSKKISFTWQAPSSDLGTLFFRFSVGVRNADGTVSIWLKCHRQTPLKYYQEIQPEVLFSIEHPLSGHTNFRKVGVGLLSTPPQTQRVVHESPTSTAKQAVGGASASTPGILNKPRRRPLLAHHPINSTLETDGYSWCKPYGAPRFQIVAGTNCRRYTMYPNSQFFDCYPGLLFSVKNCVCSHRRLDSPCTYP